MADRWKVTIEVTVTDEDALMTEAREKCLADGGDPDWITDPGEAARWLIDPGSDNLPGTTILESCAERVADLSGGEGDMPIGSMASRAS